MNTKLIFLFSLCVFGSFQLLAQDPFFSQYNQGESILNPALIGNIEGDKKNKLSANYRNYWKSDYQIALLGYERKFSLNNDQIGIGLAFLQEKAELESRISHNNFMLSIAYHKRINTNQKIQIGASTILERHLVNIPILSWPDENEGFSFNYDIINGEEDGASNLLANFNTGLVWTIASPSGNRFQLGTSVYYLNESNNPYPFFTGLLHRTPRWNVHTSYLLRLGNKWDMTPSFLVLYQAYPGTNMLVAGSDFSFKIGTDNTLIFGTHTRLSRHYPQDDLVLGSFIGMLGYQYNNLNFRFSCDIYRTAIYRPKLKNAFEFSTAWVF